MKDLEKMDEELNEVLEEILRREPDEKRLGAETNRAIAKEALSSAKGRIEISATMKKEEKMIAVEMKARGNGAMMILGAYTLLDKIRAETDEDIEDLFEQLRYMDEYRGTRIRDREDHG